MAKSGQEIKLCECGCGLPTMKRYAFNHHWRAKRAAHFWERIRKSAGNGCWIWTGYADARGVGYVSMGLRRTASGGRKYVTTARRAAWELTNGPVPDGKMVARCLQEATCVRPEHLALVASMSEAAGRRGTVCWGECSPKHKYTVEQIKDMRDLAAQHWSYGEIARAFGTDVSQVSRVVRGERWSRLRYLLDTPPVPSR